MNMYDLDHIIGDFEDSLYDGGGEANRGDYCGGGYHKVITYSYLDNLPVVGQTKKAVCVTYQYSDDKIDEWFPKSQIRDVVYSDILGKTFVSFAAPDWLLDAKSNSYNELYKKCSDIEKEYKPESSIQPSSRIQTSPTNIIYDDTVKWLRCPSCNHSQFGISHVKGEFVFQCVECGRILDSSKCNDSMI